MKRTLSLILAALLLASSMASCGKTEPETEKTETKAGETEVFETVVLETTAAETDASASSYATDRITENGVAASHIVLLDGASQLEKYASEELVTHIKLVSGADVAVTNEIQADSMPIIIATPDSLPALEELFPEDLAWLRDLGNPKEDVRWGDDGFSIRQLDGKIYIFGATPRGALNGVYDFIEDNMGVLWTRAESTASFGTIYDEMPTIALTAVNYREKSPFDVRSWTAGGQSILNSRNKLNTMAIEPFNYGSNYTYDDIGLQPFITNHNISWWITNSPSYDSTCTEYWSTDTEGTHATSPATSTQVNIWSDLTVQCIADSVMAFLEKHAEDNITYVGICLEDIEAFSVYPEMKEPYEYAPGEFSVPSDKNYLSNVFYSFLHKILHIVNEKYPEVRIHTYAYERTIEPPTFEIEENLYITIAPIYEDLLSPIGESPRNDANLHYRCLLGWMEKTPNMQVYNYYGCYRASPIYERPLWDRIQSDLQMYAENGLNGLVPEGHGDGNSVIWTMGNTYVGREYFYYAYKSYAMNAMTYWIYAKLAWNPYEDVESLVKYYCEKAYGDGAEYMLEYYRLLRVGMEDGRDTMENEFNNYYEFYTDPSIYWEYFLNIEVDGVVIIDAIAEALHNAYDATDDKGKERLAHIVEVYDNAESAFMGTMTEQSE